MARPGVSCPAPFRASSPSCVSTPVCVSYVGGSGLPARPEDQTFVEVTKCCDDTTGDGVGDTTFFKILVVDGTGATQSSSTVNGSGAAYAPVSEVPCGIQTDLEMFEACYQDITDPTIRYTRITLVNVTNQEVDGVIWLDAAGLSIAEPAAASIEPCVDAEYTDIQTRCGCDDVNGDGSDYVSFVEAFKVTCTGGVVESVLIGTFTDATLSTPYTVINPVDCDSVGDDACVESFNMCDNGTNFIRLIDVLTGTVIRDMDGFGQPYTASGQERLGWCEISAENIIIEQQFCVQ